MNIITPETLDEKKELKKAIDMVLNEAEISALGDNNKKVMEAVDLVKKNFV